jgi:hypothetical protein
MRALLARVEVFTARKSELQSFRALVTRGQSRRETTGWISKRNRVFPERRIVEREFRRSSLTMTPFSVVKLIALASSMVGSVSMPATTADVQKKTMRCAYKQKLSI